MVGAVRFELTTSCTPSKRANQATLRPDQFPPAPEAPEEDEVNPHRHDFNARNQG